MEGPKYLALRKHEYFLKNRKSLWEEVVKPYFNVQTLNSLAGILFNDAKPQPRISDFNRI
jgi:hypothetical protein